MPTSVGKGDDQAGEPAADRDAAGRAAAQGDRPGHQPGAGAEPTRSWWRTSVARQAAAGRLEPWRDWALLCAFNHAVLLTAALLTPDWPALLLAIPPLGVGFAIATLTVLHDAGHRRLARRTWPNVLAVQTAAPISPWLGHWTLKHRVHHRLSHVYPFDEFDPLHRRPATAHRGTAAAIPVSSGHRSVGADHEPPTREKESA